MNRYISMLDIESYRGIRNLEINDMGGINILVGDNNTGKTSVLEAVQLICDPSEYNLISVAGNSHNGYFARRLGRVQALLCMFNSEDRESFHMLKIQGVRKNESGAFVVSGRTGKSMNDAGSFMVKEDSVIDYYDNGQLYLDVEMDITKAETDCFSGTLISTFPSLQYERQLEIDADTKFFKPDEVVNDIVTNRFVHAFEHIVGDPFGNTIRDLKRKEKAVSLLQYFDENITDLRYINDNSRYIPVVENVKKGMLPLAVYGDGMKKVLTLLDAVVSAENGVVLIDEFETAIHTSIMEKCFRFLIKMAETLHVQMFMTTHSLEAVDKFLEAGNGYLDEIKVIRLKNTGKNTSARILDGVSAKNDRERYDVELRV